VILHIFHALHPLVHLVKFGVEHAVHATMKRNKERKRGHEIGGYPQFSKEPNSKEPTIEKSSLSSTLIYILVVIVLVVVDLFLLSLLI
jgi:hypothetical protein